MPAPQKGQQLVSGQKTAAQGSTNTKRNACQMLSNCSEYSRKNTTKLTGRNNAAATRVCSAINPLPCFPGRHITGIVANNENANFLLSLVLIPRRFKPHASLQRDTTNLLGYSNAMYILRAGHLLVKTPWGL